MGPFGRIDAREVFVARTYVRRSGSLSGIHHAEVRSKASGFPVFSIQLLVSKFHLSALRISPHVPFTSLPYLLTRFIQRRTIWWPTLPGWLILLGLFSAPLLWWWFEGESFLSRTERLPAAVLVVEAWIGREGVHAAKAEFDRSGYDFVITTGAPIENRWAKQPWNFAEFSGRELIALGISPDKIIVTQLGETKTQRTFESAVAVRHALAAKNLHPAAVNVLTIGAHARRSRLIFAKVLGPEIRVGVISYTPSTQMYGPWWKSSDRAEDLLKETVGWLFEALLNSGRTSNSPTKPKSE
jgi:hypothetical protein